MSTDNGNGNGNGNGHGKIEYTDQYLARQFLDLYGENGERWCSRAYAKNSHGDWVDPTNSGAVKFCSAAGMLRALNAARLRHDADLENALVRFGQAWDVVAKQQPAGLHAYENKVDANERGGFPVVKKVLQELAEVK